MQINHQPTCETARHPFSIRITLAIMIAMLANVSIGFAQTQTEQQDQRQTAVDQEKDPEPFQILFAEDGLQMTVSGRWKKIKPKSNMIEIEIQLPKQDDDLQDGRLTIMGAGGSIEANITRWEGQFSQQDGTTKRKEHKIADQKVLTVSIEGTYVDSPGGPFAGGARIERENYRMLAAIIQTADRGNYFVKLYGPKNTIDKNEKRFESMIKSLEVK